MKKAKSLAIILVLAMMLMGAGYAVWTDSVVINGDVSTGEMDVVIDTISEVGLVNANGTRVDLVKGDKEATVYVDELSKDGRATFEVVLMNNGSIDAAVDNIVRNASTELIVETPGLDNTVVIEDNETHTFQLIVSLSEQAVPGQDGLSFTITPQFVQSFTN